MGQTQVISTDNDMTILDAALKGLCLTRDDVVRREGAQAASRGLARHDNPYRAQSADGVSWRAGFEGAMQA